MSVSRLTLRHTTGESAIVVGDGALEAFSEELAVWLRDRTLFVVTTPRVWTLHGEVLQSLLEGAEERVRLEVPEGEAAKSVATVQRLWGEMLTAGGKRDSRVIAFGGGSVGDVAGFATGCFLRGVGLMQVPTTLLAQVDASIGGKTGINLPAAKNSVGLFFHPWATVSDTRFLSTLPAAEIRAGLLEVVKVGVMLDPDLFEQVESNLTKLVTGHAELLAPVVAAAARAKVRLVEQDPSERDQRRLLNFGHTLGHALEAGLSYQDIRHGEAVGYGMLFALRLAVRRGLPVDTAERIRRLILRFELPPLPPLEVEDLLALMRRDKKARAKGLIWVLPQRMGEGRLTEGIEEEEIRRELEVLLQDSTAEA